MKFLKLSLQNFRSYHNEKEVILHNEGEKGNITINVGETGHGKTSINEALMWCLYGEDTPFLPIEENWASVYLNEYSKEKANEKNEDEIKMAVKSNVKIDEKEYKIIRSAKYDVENEEEKTSRLEIKDKESAELIDNPLGFINERFFREPELMQYFIIDAEEIRRLFEKNPEELVENHMDRTAGVGKLDKTIRVLDQTIKYFKSEKGDVEDAPEQLQSIIRQIETKQDAIDELKKENKEKREKINSLEEKIEGLANKGVDEAEKYVERKKKETSLKENIERINEEFQKESMDDGYLPTKFHYVFLKEIFSEIIKENKNKIPPRAKVEGWINTLEESFKDEYGGVIWDNNEKALVEKGFNLENENIEEINNIDFNDQEASKYVENQVFKKYKNLSDKTQDLFTDFKDKIEDNITELLEIRSSLERIEVETGHEELKEKFNEIEELEQHIEENKDRIEEINEGLEGDDGLKQKRKDLEKESNQCEYLNRKIEKTQELKDLCKETKKTYLDNIIESINEKSTEFLRETVDNPKRWNKIRVNHRYEFKVYREDDREISENSFNTGNGQIALLAFFFGVREYLTNQLGRDIPYVMDNPLMRLDPEHKRKLVGQLRGGARQVIMHLIPESEYNEGIFNEVVQNLNHQNRLAIKTKEGGLVEISEAKSLDTRGMIDWR